MKVAVLAETRPGEKRVAMVPAEISAMKDSGLEFFVEAGAGVAAGFTDDSFREAGATVVGSLPQLLEGAKFVLKVAPPTLGGDDGRDETGLIPADSILISFLSPSDNQDLIRKLAAGGVTAMGMEAVPRITRAQKMDALSSQATVAGYEAVLVGATHMVKFLPMFMTAAGTIRPGKALILGAGVAGLQAIATAKRLGAKVEAFDVRPDRYNLASAFKSERDVLFRLDADFLLILLKHAQCTQDVAEVQAGSQDGDFYLARFR